MLTFFANKISIFCHPTNIFFFVLWTVVFFIRFRWSESLFNSFSYLDSFGIMRVEMHWIGIGHRISQESQKTHIGNVAATYRKQDEQVNCIATISNENHTCTFIVYNFFFLLGIPERFAPRHGYSWNERADNLVTYWWMMPGIKANANS